MTALNSRKAIDKVLKWLISQAILLDWMHRERLFVEGQIIRLNNRKLLFMLIMRRFPMQRAVYGILSMQKPQGRKGHMFKNNNKHCKANKCGLEPD